MSDGCRCCKMLEQVGRVASAVGEVHGAMRAFEAVLGSVPAHVRADGTRIFAVAEDIEVPVGQADLAPEEIEVILDIVISQTQRRRARAAGATAAEAPAAVQ